MGRKHSIPNFATAACSVLLGLASLAFSDDTGLGLKNVQVTGFGSYEFGQIVQGDYGGQGIDHYWDHQVYSGIGFIANLSDRMQLVAGIEGKMWNAFPLANNGALGNARNDDEQQFSVWVTEASGTYTFSDTTEKISAKVTGGYFPYKYNPESRNLGEYMFRSLSYPGLLMNTFDFPAADLLGAKATIKLNLDKIQISNDFMVLDQAGTWPYGDVSLAYVGDCNFDKVIDFGAGIDFDNLISVNSSFTTPNAPANAVRDDSGNVIETVKSINAATKDTAFDTSYYTFRAIKPMARLSIDPKPFMGDIGRMLGSEDLKLYGEGAIIGTENYSYYYNNISQRMPVMFGFYFPTFKLLDMLNIEFEHYSNPLSTCSQNQTCLYQPPASGSYPVCLPVPGTAPSIFNSLSAAEDNSSYAWKWSVYAKKTITSHVALTLECARDHYRANYSDGYPAYFESLPYKQDWMWTAKISGNI